MQRQVHMLQFDNSFLFQYHIENCPDRKRLEDDLYVIDDPDDEREKAYQIAHDIKLPPPSENWDNV